MQAQAADTAAGILTQPHILTGALDPNPLIEERHDTSEDRYKATWNREFKLPWRKAGLLNSSR